MKRVIMLLIALFITFSLASADAITCNPDWTICDPTVEWECPWEGTFISDCGTNSEDPGSTDIDTICDGVPDYGDTDGAYCYARNNCFCEEDGDYISDSRIDEYNFIFSSREWNWTYDDSGGCALIAEGYIQRNLFLPPVPLCGSVYWHINAYYPCRDDDVTLSRAFVLSCDNVIKVNPAGLPEELPAGLTTCSHSGWLYHRDTTVSPAVEYCFRTYCDNTGWNEGTSDTDLTLTVSCTNVCDDPDRCVLSGPASGFCEQEQLGTRPPKCNYNIGCGVSGTAGWNYDSETLDYSQRIDGTTCYFEASCVQGSGYEFLSNTDTALIEKEGVFFNIPCDDPDGGCLAQNYDVNEKLCYTKFDCLDCSHQYFVNNIDDYRHCNEYFMPELLTKEGSPGGWFGRAEFCPEPGYIKDFGSYSVCYYYPGYNASTTTIDELCTSFGCQLSTDYLFGRGWDCDPSEGALLTFVTYETDLKLQAIPSKFDFAIQNETSLAGKSFDLPDTCSCEAQDFVNEEPFCDDYTPSPNASVACGCYTPDYRLVQAYNWSTTGTAYSYNRTVDRCQRLNWATCYWGQGRTITGLNSTDHGPGLIDTDVWCEQVDSTGKSCNYTTNRVYHLTYNLTTLIDVTIIQFTDDQVPAYVRTYSSSEDLIYDDGFVDSFIKLTSGSELKTNFTITDNLNLLPYDTGGLLLYCSGDPVDVIIKNGTASNSVGSITCGPEPGFYSVAFNIGNITHLYPNEVIIESTGETLIGIDDDSDPKQWFLNDDETQLRTELIPNSKTGFTGLTHNSIKLIDYDYDGFDEPFLFNPNLTIYDESSDSFKSMIIDQYAPLNGVQDVSNFTDLFFNIESVLMSTDRGFFGILVDDLVKLINGESATPPVLYSEDVPFNSVSVFDYDGDGNPNFVLGMNTGLRIQGLTPDITNHSPITGLITLEFDADINTEAIVRVGGDGLYLFDNGLFTRLMKSSDSEFAVLDIDNNGFDDVVSVDDEGRLSYWENVAGFALVNRVIDEEYVSPVSIAAGDIDLDTHADVFIVDSDTVYRYEINSSDKFEKSIIGPAADYGYSLAIGEGFLVGVINEGFVNTTGFIPTLVSDSSNSALMLRLNYGSLNPITTLDLLFPDIILTPGTLKVKSFEYSPGTGSDTDALVEMTDYKLFGSTLYCGEVFNVTFDLSQNEVQRPAYESAEFTFRVNDAPIYCNNSFAAFNLSLPVELQGITSVSASCQLPNCWHGLARNEPLSLCVRAGNLEYENCYALSTSIRLAGDPTGISLASYSFIDPADALKTYDLGAVQSPDSITASDYFNVTGQISDSNLTYDLITGARIRENSDCSGSFYCTNFDPFNLIPTTMTSLDNQALIGDCILPSDFYTLCAIIGEDSYAEIPLLQNFRVWCPQFEVVGDYCEFNDAQDALGDCIFLNNQTAGTACSVLTYDCAIIDCTATGCLPPANVCTDPNYDTCCGLDTLCYGNATASPPLIPSDSVDKCCFYSTTLSQWTCES